MLRTNRNDLTVGMITVEDVHDRRGRLLLPSGTELTEKHLHIFKLWGIIDVAVRQQADSVTVSSDAKGVKSIHNPLWDKEKKRMKRLFRHADLEHPFFNSLFQLCVDRKVHSKSSEDSIVK